MSKFCKVFETIKHGQILVQLIRGIDDAPTISWSMNTGDFNINGIDVLYPNTTNGWEYAIAVLDDLNTEMAYRVAEQILKLTKKEE